MPDSRRTAVIITTFDAEALAVAHHLDELPHEREHREERGTVYEIGTFSGEHGVWTVVMTETGPGNSTAGVELERANAVFAPQLTLLVGVAGGLKDVGLGDVVAADVVYDYESVKDTDRGDLLRIKTQPSSYALVQHARLVARLGQWASRIRRTDSERDGPWAQPRAVVKPIAAGGKLVAGARSRTANLLRRACSDAVAVEMEGYGFLQGAYRNQVTPALVIRGISDMLSGKDSSHDAEWQPRAASHAAAFAFAVLDSLGRGLFPAGSPSTDTAAAIHNLPMATEVFVGRDLSELDGLLSGDGTGAVVGQAAVYGLGGIGKTQLAVHYAHKTLSRYRLVWWIEADTAENIVRALAALARKLDPVTPFTDPHAWAIRWLQANSGWLLILDNVEKIDDFAQLWGQVKGNGQVILTTRRDLGGALWRNLGLKPLPLDVLPRQASIQMLLELTGYQDRPAAGRLAKDLGDLPLALQQAAAYISQHEDLTFDGYRTLLTTQFQRVAKNAGAGGLTQHTIASVWKVTMRAVTARSSLAERVLAVLAWLNPDGLEAELLGPLSDDQADLADALALLRSYNLIGYARGVVSVHRLVQAVTRAADRPVPGAEMTLSNADQAIALLAAAMPADPVAAP